MLTAITASTIVPLLLFASPLAQATDGDAPGASRSVADVQDVARLRAVAWVRMLDGDLPIEDLYADHFSPAFRAKMPPQRARMIFGVLKEFYAGGKARMERVDVGKDAVTVTLSNTENRLAEYELMFEPGDAQRHLGGFNAQILGNKPASEWNGLTQDALIAKAAAHVDRLAGEDRFSGSILIARRDSVLLQKAFGTRTPEGREPNAVETPYPIASITKVLTALAVAVLVDRGTLELDESIGTYLPELPNPRIREEVTVKHLLMHTSGVASMMFAEDLPGSESSSLEELACAVARRPLSTDPGKAYQYSNGGTILLGYLVEHVAEEPYVNFLKSNVLEPAGMTRSGFLYGTHYPGYVAVGAFTGPSGHTGTTKEQFSHAVNPANSGYATVGDLFALSQALFLRSGFSQGVLDALTAESVVANSQMEQTTGLMKKRFGDRDAFGHTGGMPGISAQWWYVPDVEVCVAVLSNRIEQAEAVAEPILNGLGTMIPR